MKTTLALCACTQETDEGTASAALFKRSDVAVVAIGPASCLRHLYFLAIRLQALEQLHLCCITPREYALGNFRTKVRERLDRVLGEQTVGGILVYGTCADILMQVDFEELLAGLENPAGIPVKIFCRGPLEKRKMPAVKRLQILYQELEDEMPGPAGELSHPHGEKAFFLPPLAGDFAGVVSMLQDWNCELILYTSGGCRTGLQLDEPSERPPCFFYTSYNDIHAVLGSEGKLVELMRESPPDQGRIGRALVSTPVPYITGCDFEWLKQELSSPEYPFLCFPCNGFDTYAVGMEWALLTLGRTFFDSRRRVSRQILLAGCSAMEPVSRSHLQGAVDKIEELGFSVFFLGDGGIESVRQAAAASLCWCVSSTGEALAGWLEETFGTSWFTHLPIGRRGMNRLLELISERGAAPTGGMRGEGAAAAPGASEASEVSEAYGDVPRILIISEPLTGLGIQQCLFEDFAYAGSRVAVYGLGGRARGFEEDQFGQPIVRFQNPEEIKGLVCSADILIADPLYERLAQSWGTRPLFISVPYPALSGNLYSRSPIDLIGEEGYQYFASKLGKERKEKKQ